MCTILPGIQADNSNNVQVTFIKTRYFSGPHKVGTFGEGRPIYGIHRCKGSIYVARDSTPHVEIYDARLNNNRKGNLSVTGMKGPYDLVGNAKARSLFIADWLDTADITTVSTKAQNQVARFPINGDALDVVGLAAATMSSDSDVIVTCSRSMKIKEFKKSGTLVRQVQLPSEITQPRHAIKLASGEGYAVCHGYGSDDQHRVCLVDNAGNVGDCFGNKAGDGPAHLDVCARVAEDDNQNILVADRNNKRVILLSNRNGKLKFEQEVVRKMDGLNGPYRILIDGPVLYVVDNTVDKDGSAVSARVVVFRVNDEELNF